MLFGGRSFGNALHWQPEDSTWNTAFSTSRAFAFRGLPPRFAGRIIGVINAHSLSLNSDPANDDLSNSRASGGWGHGPQTPFFQITRKVVAKNL